MNNLKQPTKSISEWLSELPFADEALAEMKLQGRQDDQVSTMFVAIHMAFHWLSSVKGFDYWYYKFKEIRYERI